MSSSSDEPEQNPPLASLADSAPSATNTGDDGTQFSPKPQPKPTGWANGLPQKLPCQFGRYELQRQLGRGGMGAVYLAHDAQLNRLVAVKIPLFSGPDAEQLRQRFYREARAAALVEHPCICPIHDVGEIEGVHFFSMRYIQGHSLRELIRPEKPIPERAAADLIRKLALAMAEAHARGVIHRDLKPANIIIQRDRQPVIMDFGLARVGTEGQQLTRTGAAMGTPAYMPPEQVNGEVQRMGPGCDIYSLGVILFEMLAGRPPFRGKYGELMAQIVATPPPFPSQFRPGLSPVLDAICLKALQKQPEERFQSMLEFAEALEGYLAGQPPPSTLNMPSLERKEETFADLLDQIEAATTAPESITPAPPKPRRRWIWAGIASILLLVVVVLLMVTRGPGEGTVRVQLSDPHARVEVLIDGRLMEPGPDETYRLKAGEHRVEVNGRAYEPYASTFVVRSGASETVSVPLKLRPVKPPPGPVIGTAPLDDVMDFREIHGADLKTLDAWMDQMRDAGMRPNWLNVWSIDGKPRFTAIAVRDGRRIPFIQHLHVPVKDYQPWFDAEKAKGRRPIQRVAYQEDGVWWQAWIWYQDPLAHWGSWHANRPFATGKLREAHIDGLQLRSISRYDRDGQQYFTISLLPVGAASWKEYLDLSPAELRQNVRDSRRTGWRPDVISAYQTADGGVGFSAVFTEDGTKIGWSFDMDLTTEDYERAIATNKNNGMRPIAVAPYEVGGAARYAVAWAAYRPASPR